MTRFLYGEVFVVTLSPNKLIQHPLPEPVGTGAGGWQTLLGVLVFCESIEDFMRETFTRDYDGCVVIQGNFLRNLCRVLPVRKGQ